MDQDFRLLLVDDQPAVLRALKRLLGMCFEIEVDTAPSAAVAWQLLAERPYAVVISDFHMPGEDGVSLAGRIARQHPETRTILLSAHFETLYAGRASMAEGVFEIVPKPWQMRHLLGVVRAAWRNSGAGPRPPPYREAALPGWCEESDEIDLPRD